MINCDFQVRPRPRRAPQLAFLAVLTLLSAVACSPRHRVASPAAEVSGGFQPTPGHLDRPSTESAAADRESDLVAIPMPDPAPQRIEPAASPRIIDLEGGVRAWVGGGRVEFPGEITLETGWLEVAVCRRSTREHESIVVADVVPSVVHAALLLAGFEPGAPAAWDQETNSPIPPRGPLVTIEIRFGPSGPDGPEAREVRLESMIEDARERALPRWVFAGSLLRPNPPSMGEGEYFLADYAGTFVGLTTFGDEVIAAEEVRSPETGVDPPVWRIREGSVPPVGTPVTVVVRRPPAASE
ncbi:MAG: hypothetical protein CMJ27_09720 [Phycisphaerae bacterium]|nr:hypothetical protein [Phycisphaerae bacterium]OUX00813.1 MAG: hypothetical protein CBD91_05870 [Phycisphaeraceae bacterium TMED231]